MSVTDRRIHRRCLGNIIIDQTKNIDLVSVTDRRIHRRCLGNIIIDQTKNIDLVEVGNNNKLFSPAALPLPLALPVQHRQLACICVEAKK